MRYAIAGGQYRGNPCAYYTSLLWDEQHGLPPKPPVLFRTTNDAKNLCHSFSTCMNTNYLATMLKPRGVQVVSIDIETPQQVTPCMLKPTPAPTPIMSIKQLLHATIDKDGYKIIGSSSNPQHTKKLERASIINLNKLINR